MKGIFNKIPPEFRWPLGIAVALHITIIVFLWVSLPSPNYQTATAKPRTQIVHAKTLSQRQVRAQVAAVAAREQAKREAVRQKALARTRAAAAKRRALAARQARAAAAKRRALAARRAKQKAARQARVAAAKRRAKQKAVQQARAAEAKRRALAIRQAKQKVAKQLAAKRIAAQARALALKQKQLQQRLLDAQLSQEQQQLHRLQAQHNATIVDQYKAEIVQAIGQNWVIPSNVNRQLSAQFVINLAPGGVVLQVKLLRSSGDSTLDQSARVAIFKGVTTTRAEKPSLIC